MFAFSDIKCLPLQHLLSQSWFMVRLERSDIYSCQDIQDLSFCDNGGKSETFQMRNLLTPESTSKVFADIKTISTTKPFLKCQMKENSFPIEDYNFDHQTLVFRVLYNQFGYFF